MPSPTRTLAACALALLTLTTDAVAQGRVLVVDDGPTAAAFTTIQAAVDAAQPGDTLWVRPGTYGRFEIAGKGIAVMAEVPGTVELLDYFDVQPAIHVRDLPAGQELVLSGIRARRIYTVDDDEHATVRLLDNDGVVVIQDCDLQATASTEAEPTGRALRVRTSASVVVSRSVLVGGVHAIASGTSLFGCELTGPFGRDCAESHHALRGRAGFSMWDGTALLSGCTVTGGEGGDGDASLNCCKRSGGPGVLLDGTSPLLEELDSVVVAGLEGIDYSCGVIVPPSHEVLAGSVSTLTGLSRSGSQAGLTHVGDPLRLVHEGLSGDLVLIGVAPFAAPLSLPPLGGVLLPDLLTLQLFSLGTAGPDPMILDAPLPGILGGTATGRLVLQPYFLDPTLVAGPGVLSDPGVAVLADLTVVTTAAPDCDGSGVADLWEVLTAGVPDDDLDGIPNACDTMLVLHVDDDAPGDPGPGNPLVSDPLEDGSAAHPFDAVQEAIDSLPPAGTPGPHPVILLADGLYRGLGNRELDPGGRALTVRSAGGPAACVLDGEDVTQLFRITKGEGPTTLLEGLTLVRGRGDQGGAVYVEESDPVLRGCVVLDSVAIAPFSGFGGGVYGTDTRLALIDCHFEGNHTAGSGGAVFLESDLSHPSGDHPDPPLVLRCTFVANTALSGGGLSLGSSIDGLVVEDSTFTGNHASNDGGGLYLAAPAEVRDCFVAGNRAEARGGGMSLTANYGPVSVRGCTLRGNQAGQAAGGLHVFGVGGSLADSILWENVADDPLAAQEIFLNGSWSTVELSVSHSDVAGGQAGVDLGTHGVLDWGAGNLDTDPFFVSASITDPAIDPLSPCREAAAPSRSPTVFDEDLDGQARRYGSAVDMGADEVHP